MGDFELGFYIGIRFFFTSENIFQDYEMYMTYIDISKGEEVLVTKKAPLQTAL